MALAALIGLRTASPEDDLPPAHPSQQEHDPGDAYEPSHDSPDGNFATGGLRKQHRVDQRHRSTSTDFARTTRASLGHEASPAPSDHRVRDPREANDRSNAPGDRHLAAGGHCGHETQPSDGRRRPPTAQGTHPPHPANASTIPARQTNIRAIRGGAFWSWGVHTGSWGVVGATKLSFDGLRARSHPSRREAILVVARPSARHEAIWRRCADLGGQCAGVGRRCACVG